MALTEQRNAAAVRPCGRMRRLPPAFYQGYAFVHWNMTMEERSRGWLSPAFHQRFREIQLHTLSRYRLLCLCYCLMPDHLHLLWAGLDIDSDQDKAATFFRKYLNHALAEAGAARLSAPGDVEGALAKAGAGSGSAPSSVPGAARLPAPGGEGTAVGRAGAGSGSAPNSAQGAARLPAPGGERTAAEKTGAGSGSAPEETRGAARLSAPALQKQAWDVVLREPDRARGAVEKLLFYITENPVRKGHASVAQEWAFSGSQAAGYPDFDWRDEQFRDRLWTIYATEVDRNRERFRSGQADGHGAAERIGNPPEPEAAPLRRKDDLEVTITGSGAAARAGDGRNAKAFRSRQADGHGAAERTGTSPEPEAAPLRPSVKPPTTD